MSEPDVATIRVVVAGDYRRCMRAVSRMGMGKQPREGAVRDRACALWDA